MAYDNRGDKAKGAGGAMDILQMLRSDLIGELEAINQYQAHIDASDDEEMKALLSHIRDDEKEHVAELTNFINRRDPVQKMKFETDHTNPETGAEGTEGEGAGGAAAGATVGSLFGQK